VVLAVCQAEWMARAQLDKKPGDVSAMFDQVAERYDLLNDVLSLGQDRFWRRSVARAVSAGPGQVVLDLAAGTGTSSRTFAEAGARCVACDFSLGMLRVGARKPATGVRFVAGDALSLPFRDEFFDAVTISFGLRNVADPGAALAEMLRVTRPGGRLVVCEFSHLPVPRADALYQRYLAAALPMVAGRLSGNAQAYGYLAESIRDWPGQRELARLIGTAGWSAVRWRNLTLGIVAVHVAQRP
jgi:demethylmenaquinone methyltransferase / 2-methoxy-6-polyprenyl-1,4-benzoquinol methylase